MSKKNLEKKITASDLGFIDDAITILIDLVHIEIHAWKSWNETKNKDWLDINNQARTERTELLTKICNKDLLNSDGELWCFNKHSLRVIGGYIELGNRELTSGNREIGIEYFEKASRWLGVFLIKNKIKGGE